MKTINLPTGIEIKQNRDGNIVTLTSPHDNEDHNLTVLRYYVKQIKQIIK